LDRFDTSVFQDAKLRNDGVMLVMLNERTIVGRQMDEIIDSFVNVVAAEANVLKRGM
jgi:hypothetical protein